MNRALPNESLFYDTSKKDIIQRYLEYYYELAVQNPNFNLNSGVIYNDFKFGGLPDSDKTVRDGRLHGRYNRQFYERWEKDFKRTKNINAFCDEYGDFRYWFQFTNTDPSKEHEYIKIYVPLNSQHLFKGVEELFSFIAKENIKHASKVAEEARIDNVIIRIYKDDVESLYKIINFIRNNKYLSTGLNFCNPFVPTINGIGVMNEHGNSYNSDVSKYVASYLSGCLANRTKPNVDDLRNYIKMYCRDKDLVETFESAYLGRREFKPKTAKKQEQQKSGLSFEQKSYLLSDAMKETFNKYDKDQVYAALYHAVTENDFSYFTNQNFRLRDKLQNNLTGEDIMQIIKYALSNLVHPVMMPKNVEGKITRFVNLMFSNDLVLSFDEACSATLEKHGADFLLRAIYNYIYFGDPQGFTRQGNSNKNINLRAQVMKINKDELLEYMKQSLKLKGYEIDDQIESEIPQVYVDTLVNSRYAAFNDSPVITK